MKKSKKFVLAGLFLLAAIITGLTLTGCETEVDPSTPQQEQPDGNTGNSGGGNTQQPGGDNSGNEDEVGGEKPVTYTVSFDSSGGSEVASQTVESGKAATQPDNPTKTDYNFDGWYTSADTAYDFETAVTQDITLYAKWTPVYTVTFNSNGGAFADGSTTKTETVEINDRVLRPESDPTKPNELFDNWYTEADGGSVYDFTEPVTADIPLYAKYVPPVATVTTEDGIATNYAILNEAIDAASQGSTLTLKADVDVTEQIQIPANKNFTLDLNGHTISGKVNSIVKVDKAATLTITDSSQQKNGAITTTDYTGVYNLGTLIVNDGTISATNVGVGNVGTLTVNGGTISSNEYGVHNLTDTGGESASTTVTGGVIKGKTGVHNEWGTLTVSGGTISGTECGVSNLKTFYLSGDPTIEGKLRLSKSITLVGELTGTFTVDAEYYLDIIAEGGSLPGETEEYRIAESDKEKFTISDSSGSVEVNTRNNMIEWKG